jgi:acyl-[acyl-carrier-protein]--UDP-N-acetylglucosamine O-acyltransferase
MSLFHPRAMIHPKAQIGAGTSVGADVIIDEHVVIGENCEIRARAIITGHTRIGNENQIGYGVIIGSEPQDTAYKGAISFVEIGDRNIIREYVTINRGTAEHSTTKIGNDNLLFTGCHIAHNCQVGNGVTLVNNVLLAGYVEVRNYAFIGGDAVIHQFNRIGEFVMIRGQTRLSLDVPPYCMAVDTNCVSGLNRVGLRRRGFDHQRRKRIQRAFDIVFNSHLNRLQALEAISQDPELADDPDIKLFCDFIRETKRGICRLYRDPRWEAKDE